MVLRIYRVSSKDKESLGSGGFSFSKAVCPLSSDFGKAQLELKQQFEYEADMRYAHVLLLLPSVTSESSLKTAQMPPPSRVNRSLGGISDATQWAAGLIFFAGH